MKSNRYWKSFSVEVVSVLSALITMGLKKDAIDIYNFLSGGGRWEEAYGIQNYN